MTSILPVKDKKTGHAQQSAYANEMKTMNVQSIVHVCDNIEENTVANGDAWCTNLVSQFHIFSLT